MYPSWHMVKYYREKRDRYLRAADACKSAHLREYSLEQAVECETLATDEERALYKATVAAIAKAEGK